MKHYPCSSSFPPILPSFSGQLTLTRTQLLQTQWGNHGPHSALGWTNRPSIQWSLGKASGQAWPANLGLRRGCLRLNRGQRVSRSCLLYHGTYGDDFSKSHHHSAVLRSPNRSSMQKHSTEITSYLVDRVRKPYLTIKLTLCKHCQELLRILLIVSALASTRRFSTQDPIRPTLPKEVSDPELAVRFPTKLDYS